MTNYHNYPTESIGYSDIAMLIAVGYDANGDDIAKVIKYGGDGSYSAHIVDEKCDIPAHYHEVARFCGFCRIYDDRGLNAAYDFAAKTIVIYRAGEMGTMIQLIRGESNE